MSYYRLYFMSASSGHILRFAEYEAPDDEAAIALAAEHEGAEPLELWCQHRKVKRFERDPIPAAPFSGSAESSAVLRADGGLDLR